jgi:hypothetical protein
MHRSLNLDFLFLLHVPGFPFNLLFISKITKILHYCVSFYLSLCIFQDLQMKRMIGMGHEVGGLYYLDFAHNKLSLNINSQYSRHIEKEKLNTTASRRWQTLIEFCRPSRGSKQKLPSFDQATLDRGLDITTCQQSLHKFHEKQSKIIGSASRMNEIESY